MIQDTNLKMNLRQLLADSLNKIMRMKKMINKKKLKITKKKLNLVLLISLPLISV